MLGILILGWFSWFAYGVVDASREDAAKAEKKVVEEKVKTLEKSMADSATANTVREADLRKLLPLIKTDDEKAVEKAAAPAEKPEAKE